MKKKGKLFYVSFTVPFRHSYNTNTALTSIPTKPIGFTTKDPRSKLFEEIMPPKGGVFYEYLMSELFVAGSRLLSRFVPLKVINYYF